MATITIMTKLFYKVEKFLQYALIRKFFGNDYDNLELEDKDLNLDRKL